MSSRAYTAALVCVLLGLAASVAAAVVHFQLATKPGYESFCDVNATFSCAQAYQSEYGRLLGAPISILGAGYFAALLALLDSPTFWVKVSGVDRITRLGPPYDDAVPFAARLVADFGDRVVWGNDWPHPNHAGPVPVEEELAAQIHRMAPTADALQRLMVDNPQRLYRFNT